MPGRTKAGPGGTEIHARRAAKVLAMHVVASVFAQQRAA